MKQNRSIKTSNKPKYKSDKRKSSFSKGESEELILKRVPEDELTQIRKEIRDRIKVINRVALCDYKALCFSRSGSP